MSVAHLFTLLRILIIPLFPIFYLYYSSLGISFFWVPVILIILLSICEFSDLFDGFLARKKNQVTDLGKVFDPMADSITRITVFFTFTQGVIALPILLVLVFLYREFVINTFRTLCALRGYALAARMSGKIKAILQAVAAFLILVLMIFYNVRWISLTTLRVSSLITVSLVAAYAVLSMIDYFVSNWQFVKKAVKKI